MGGRDNFVRIDLYRRALSHASPLSRQAPATQQRAFLSELFPAIFATVRASPTLKLAQD